ncbi:ammonium transporter [Planctomycetota bacterium]|nr:ammonium transporter [Planctomycetota bacterium]
MARLILPLFAVLALAWATTAWAEEPAAAAPPAPAAAPPAAAAPAAPPHKNQANIDAGKAWFGTYVAPGTKDDKGAEIAATPINNGDNAWMLVSCALVLLMTIPGLALFYGGLVRRKNTLSTMMHSFSLAAVVTVIWTICGFALAFGGGGWFYGGFADFVMLKGVAFDPALAAHSNRFPINLDYAPTISFAVFCMFQLMFAIITPALISGAFAERIKFSGMLVFTVLWLLFCYIPLAHMVWGKNGLFNWGFGATEWAAFDFAGGTVVHISSGIAALMCAIFLGKRKGYPERSMTPHSLVLSVIGAALLWVGWFGFNAGSALGANGLAALAFTNTQIATAAAALSWPLAEWIIRGKPTVLGAISGAVAGLVAITPACGFVEPGSALIIGLLAGLICFSAVTYLKRLLGYDDALDAFGVHGIGGIWGAIATGLFFSVDVNPNLPALNDGLYKAIVDGTHPVVLNQIKAVLVTIVLSAVVSVIALLIVKFTVGLRVTETDEEEGLDLSQHGEEAYSQST